MSFQHRARKRFGQNFLRDPGVIARMVRLIDPQPGQALVEIGPGLAALTRPLLERLGRMDVVELDRDLVEELARRCADAGELAIHQGDALRFDFGNLRPAEGRLRVVGNLPYNISTPLIFHLLDDADAIQDMHFTLQKEVVERLAAAAGSDSYGRLSVMVQYRCRVESLFHIPPGAFTPAPKVDSGFVRLVPHESLPWPADEPTALGRVVAQAFSQRRKTLRNTLRGLLEEAEIVAAELDPGIRPEQVDVAGYVRLSNRLTRRPARP